jgi:hypothetical protein
MAKIRIGSPPTETSINTPSLTVTGSVTPSFGPPQVKVEVRYGDDQMLPFGPANVDTGANTFTIKLDGLLDSNGRSDGMVTTDWALVTAFLGNQNGAVFDPIAPPNTIAVQITLARK